MVRQLYKSHRQGAEHAVNLHQGRLISPAITTLYRTLPNIHMVNGVRQYDRGSCQLQRYPSCKRKLDLEPELPAVSALQ